MQPEQHANVAAQVVDIVEDIAGQPLEGPLDQDLLVSGYLDSFGFVQLLLQLNSQLGLTIDEETQLDPRLRSISGIAGMMVDG